MNPANAGCLTVNLETSVTRNDEPWPTAARVDVWVLANNHVLDYVDAGLEETLETLHRAGLATAGAGRTLAEAQRPAVIDLAAGSRVVVYGFGTWSSGIPPSRAATEQSPGVDLLADLSKKTAAAIGQRVEAVRRSGDIVIASIHWGSNWGYQVPAAQIGFARRLIDGGRGHRPRPFVPSSSPDRGLPRPTAAATSSTTTRASAGSRSTGPISRSCTS